MKKILLTLFATVILSTASMAQQFVLFTEAFENPFSILVTSDATSIGIQNYGPNQWIINDEYDGMGIYPNTPDQNQTVGGTISYAPFSHYLHIVDSVTMASNGVANANYNPQVASEDFAYVSAGFCTLGLEDVIFTFFYIGEGNSDAWLELYYSADGGPWTQTGQTQYNHRDLWQYEVVQDPAFDHVSSLQFGFRFINTGNSSTTSIGFGVDDLIAVGTYDDQGNPTDLIITDIFPDTMCQLDPFVILWELTGPMCEATYEVELSNGNGNFSNPQSLGVFQIGAGDTVGGVFIPSANIGAVPPGNCYKIRINRLSPPPQLTGVASFCFVIEECPNSITTLQPPVTFGPDTLCVQSVIDIPFYSYGVYNPGNVYTAWLSDSAGNFTNPYFIGSSTDFTTYDPAINPNVPGMVSGLVPVVPDGCNYYIQIVADNPLTYGTLFGPFCIHHCDIETNNTMDVHICIYDTIPVCDTLIAELDVYGQNVQYLNGNQFLMQLIDPVFYTIVNTGGIGAVYDTAINSFIICVPPLADLLAMGIAPGMYYARIISDSTNSSWNYLGSLIHLTIGAPYPDGLTIIPSDTTVCQNDVVYMYIDPYNPDSEYQWVSDCLAGDNGQVGTPLSWPYNPLAILFTPGNQSYDCTFQVREINFGCIGPWSDPITIFALGPPNIDIQGPSPVCVGDTAHYTVPFFPETYFLWTVDTSVATITNPANDEIYLVWDEPGIHYLVCYANNSCNFESIDSIPILVVEPVDVYAGEDTTVCGAQPVDLFATISGDATNHLLTTVFNGTSGGHGAMFDVNALNEITITSFDGNFSTPTVDLEIYYKIGTFVNFDISPGAWTFIGSANGVPANGMNQPTPIPIPINITIPAGQTYAFYITTTGSQNQNYTGNGTVGTVYATDGILEIEVGIGKTYLFGTAFQPRKWNGKIHYVTNAGFTFDWSNGTVGEHNPVNPSLTTVYTVNVSDTIGCSGKDTVIVFIKPTPVADAGPDSVICNGQTIQLNASGGDAYQWVYEPSLSEFFIADPIASPDQDVTYIVQVFDTSSGCWDYDTLSVSVNQNTVLEDSSGLCEGQPIELIPVTDGAYYLWSNGSTSQSIIVTLPGVYYVQVSSGPNDCGTVEQFIINLTECFLLLDPPNAFSPNGDGTNDFFTIYGEDIAEWELWIFNRWGEEVYYTTDVTELNDPNRGWNGTHNGKPQDMGVFVFVIQAKGYEGTPIKYKGNITLLR